MKKKLLLLFANLTLIFSITGCGLTNGEIISKDVADKVVEVGGSVKDNFKKTVDSVGYNTTAKKAQLEGLQSATLIRVVDGDTIVCSTDSDEEYKVRLIGIDTPESVNPDESLNSIYGTYASDYTKGILDEISTVYLQYDEEIEDQYGRKLAYVWLINDANTNNLEHVSNYMLNAILVEDGYALSKSYSPNLKYQEYFDELCEGAKKEGIGLWQYGEIASLSNE